MFDYERFRNDVLALGLLALVVFVGLSFLSYDPADPPSDLTAAEDVVGGVLVHPQVMMSEVAHAAVDAPPAERGELVAGILGEGDVTLEELDAVDLAHRAALLAKDQALVDLDVDLVEERAFSS